MWDRFNAISSGTNQVWINWVQSSTWNLHTARKLCSKPRNFNSAPQLITKSPSTPTKPSIQRIRTKGTLEGLEATLARVNSTSLTKVRIQKLARGKIFVSNMEPSCTLEKISLVPRKPVIWTCTSHKSWPTLVPSKLGKISQMRKNNLLTRNIISSRHRDTVKLWAKCNKIIWRLWLIFTRWPVRLCSSSRETMKAILTLRARVDKRQ